MEVRYATSFLLFECDIVTTESSERFDNSPVNITDGEWHTIQWLYDREVSVEIDGYLLQSQTPMTWGNVYELAAGDIVYLHLGGLTNFDSQVLDAFIFRGKCTKVLTHKYQGTLIK